MLLLSVLKEGAVFISKDSPCQYLAGSPVSRILSLPAKAGGTPPFIWARRHRLAQAAYPLRFPGFPGIHAGSMMRVNAFLENVCPDRNIFGLATHKVYPHTVSPRCAVGSYPTFSPFSRQRRMVFFCGTCCQVPAFAGTSLPVRKYGALCCPDFPPPPFDGSGRAGCRPVQRYKEYVRIAVCLLNIRVRPLVRHLLLRRLKTSVQYHVKKY